MQLTRHTLKSQLTDLISIGRLKSRLKGVPPTVGLRRRSVVHAGGRSAKGSPGATSSRQPTAA